MEAAPKTEPRIWRKLVKKLQRKRRRQAAARQLAEQSAQEQKAREADPAYKIWLQQQAVLEEFQRMAAQQSHEAEEAAWLHREAIAQQQFRIDEAKRQEQAEIEQQERLKQAKELEALQAEKRKQREEQKRLAAQAAAEFEATLAQMQRYLDDDTQRVPPVQLLRNVETRPEQKLCEFYERTNCCRYGATCTFNHRRPLLAKIILIPHFFTHPLLKHAEHNEYGDGDNMLELNEHDLREDYDQFFNDVVPELNKFGKIINFRAVRNVVEHLRGNVFVEYETERAALKAFINLQGRYYAAKRLSVEFSNLKHWRGAVCGLSLTRKCPRGLLCGYLHLFKNPNNLYNTPLGTGQATPMKMVIAADQTPSYHEFEGRANWRWSESPEPEPVQQKQINREGPTIRDNHKAEVSHSDLARTPSKDVLNGHTPNSRHSSSKKSIEHKNNRSSSSKQNNSNTKHISEENERRKHRLDRDRSNSYDTLKHQHKRKSRSRSRDSSTNSYDILKRQHKRKSRSRSRDSSRSFKHKSKRKKEHKKKLKSEKKKQLKEEKKKEKKHRKDKR